MLGKRYEYDGEAIISLSKGQIEAKRRYFKKMRDEYRLINVNCECGTNNYDVLAKKDRYGLPVTVVICKKCGLIYQNPRLDEESLKHFYCHHYRRLHDTSSISDYFDFQFNRGERIARWLYPKLGRLPKRVIEIGCGAGGILKAFQNLGVETLGIDFDEDYVNYGRSKGLSIKYIGDLNKTFPPKADLIILSHVLEHFSDIETELSDIQNMLSPGGHLYIEVPGVLSTENFSYDFLESLEMSHIYYFTLETLKQVLSFYGWELEYGDENIFSLFNYTGHRNDVLTNYYPKVNSHLIYFEKTRHIGKLRHFLSKKHLLQLGAHAINLFKVKNSNL